MDQTKVSKVSKKYYVNPNKLKKITFIVVSICILIGVIACILSIWKFTGEEFLMRTTSTCVVISGGLIAFCLVNAIFGSEQTDNKEQ